MSGFVLPQHAHVPGHNARHQDDFFDDVKAGVQPGMPVEELRASAAYHAGFACYDAGYFWEAHEVWEAVWMATAPNSRERHFVQALIQLANARLKLVMAKPKAAARLCELVLALNAEAGDGGGLALPNKGHEWIVREISSTKNAL